MSPSEQGKRFLVDDGRHDYLAALMLGRERLFVCWLEQAAGPATRPGNSLPVIDSLESASTPALA